MAQLKVKGEFVGPGEQLTAERLRDELPADWVVFAGRKLAGENRDDVDLIIVGASLVFVLDEKHWGPTVVVDDGFWYVKEQARRNPLDRVGQLARKLAGLLRDHADGYNTVRGKRVIPGVVLSHPNIQVLSGRNHDASEQVWTLAEISARLLALDAKESALGGPRRAVLAYLNDLPAGGKVRNLGGYEIQERAAVPGVEQAFMAQASDGQRVLLKCYPFSRMQEQGDPRTFLERETRALNRLSELGRTWRALPYFEDDALQVFVVPVIPPQEARNLVKSAKQPDPPRPNGALEDQVARDVVVDAFTALAEVHELGLVHRALHPSRIWLGRRMRVSFSDFHLARMADAESIALWEPDADIGELYRAPECAVSVGLATPKSDIYSLTLCMAGWLLGANPTALRHEELKERTLDQFPWAAPMFAGLLPAAERPEATQILERLVPAPSEPAIPELPPGNDFQIGGMVAGRYELLKELGQGGFAVSWKVFDHQVEHTKVLKQFKRNIPAELRAEYGAAHTLNHDRCGRVYEFDASTEQPYLVSEYVDGQSLATAGIDRSVDELRSVAMNVLEALKYIHGKDLVHGDVNPANVIVSTDGSGEAKLIDFGLAVLAGQRPAGWSPRFASPEVLAGKPASPLSDLYGFGASLAFAMLGRVVARRDDGGVVLVPPTPEELVTWGHEGAALLGALMTGVALDPTARPRSADEYLTIVSAARVIDPPNPDVEDNLETKINPNVTALRRLYRGSSGGNAGNRGLDDDFAKATYVPTLLDTELVPRIIDGELEVVLLSGNPGDGKTSLLVQLGDELKKRGAMEEGFNKAGWRLRLGDRLFIAVYDASESDGALSSDDLVRQALDPVAADGPATALIAVNDGRLLQFFTDHEHLYEEWSFAVRDQLEGGLAPESTLALIDLKRRSLAGFDATPGPGRTVLEVLTADPLWAACTDCIASSDCPILANRSTLRSTGADAFGELMLISHLRRRRRATFRDVRSAIAWLITGDRSCADVHAWRAEGRSALHMEQALAADLAFAPASNDYLVKEWSELDPAQVAAPAVDRIFRAQSGPQAGPSYGSVASVARGLYFGTVDDPEGTALPTDVQAYRYVREFVSMLRNDAPDLTLERLLLGMSRLVGAYGYLDQGLAISSGMSGASWAILHTVPATQFSVSVDRTESPYIETIPDRLTLDHVSGPRLTLSLDTAEIILRAADGELINDVASDAIRQEIDTFVSQLSRHPSLAARIVDASGSVAVARVDGTQILLEQA